MEASRTGLNIPELQKEFDEFVDDLSDLSPFFWHCLGREHAKIRANERKEWFVAKMKQRACIIEMMRADEELGLYDLP